VTAVADKLSLVRTIFVIGIGAGSPDHLTFEGAAAIGRADVFFVLDKGTTAPQLRALREELVRRHAREPHRVVVLPDAARERQPDDYEAAVHDWHAERAARIAGALAEELDDDGVGAFLVWGDPSLYDSTLRVLDRVAATGTVEFDQVVVPGVSSVSVLAARHQRSLHGIGEPVLITTGRRLAEDLGTGVPNAVVMLDGQEAFAEIDPAGLDIHWAAYLGTPEEVVVAGDLATVRDEIVETRRAARAEHGWIMDIYLLSRRSEPPPGP
jgi:precorrin-6A synthase